jgi:hypothetical protein
VAALRVLSADGRHCRPFFLSGAGALKSSPTLAQHDPVPRNRAVSVRSKPCVQNA